MCAEGLHVVLHGKVAVGRAGTVMGVLVQVTDDGVLHGEGKTASCTKFREGQFVVVRQLHFFSQFGTDLFHVGHMAEEFIAQFGDYRKQWDFIESGFVHEIVYFHMQLPVVIERDMYLFRIEMEGGKPFPVDARKKAASTLHEGDFSFCELDATHGFHFILEGMNKFVGIFCLVAVLEREFSYGIRKQFDISVGGRKFIQVGVEYAFYNHGVEK